MRRARISIKPNVKPGGRAVAPTAESKTSQESAAVDNTQQKHTGEQTDTPSGSQQSQLEVKGPAVATGDGNVPGCPSEKASVNTSDGVPSSVLTPAATALQRRSRISATPNLARPKLRSVPPASTEKNASLPSVPSKSSPEPPVPAATSRDDSQNSTLSDSILKRTNATITPSSPGHEPSVLNTSPSSTRLQQELLHTPKKSCSGLQEAISPSSSILSPCIKLSRCYGPGPPLSTSEMSDKQRVLKALKLKELMKLERRKELKKRRSGRRMCEHSDEVDCSKMTLADFIYYLPETNPMASSFSTEEAPPETVVPLPPKVPPKLVEPKKVDDDDNDDDDDEDDDDLMVPKVRVAEDGTLILDEESLTVRVQRTSDTVVEDATPLFERGNTTTYKSFRKHYHVKIWSVRETDMFFLAISMVGTDFSMMAQLLTHRNRAEIKNKFKKEEKTNAWRVDKALQNKRPYDHEFFSFLLKRILEKDKKRGKPIKLVVKPNKANKGKAGKKGKKHEDQEIGDDSQDELDIGDNDSLDLEKENEDHNNVKVSDVTSSKKRKRKRESELKGSPGEKTCKRKKNKTKSKKGEESNCLQVEDESVNAENEDPSLMPTSKKKRKRSRKGEEKRCEELEDKRKAKRNKKTVKVKLEVSDEESLDIDGENSQAGIELKPTDTSKTCKRSKKCKEETAKGKRKTRKSKKSSEECTGDDLNDVSSEVCTAGPDAEKDQGDKPTPDTAAQEETPQHTSKRSKRPLPKIPKRKAKKCSVSNAPLENEDAAPEGQDANCRNADSEFQVDSLVDSQLQKQAVVVLERVPPSPDQSQTAESLLGTPGRQTRAEKAKENLIGSEREKNEMDNCQTASGSDTSAENMTMTTLACQDDTKESEMMEADQRMKGVEEHMDCHVEKSASGVALEEKVSQYPGVKESASTSTQQCISQKRRRFAKPQPNLTRSQQTEEKPLTLQTTEYIDDNPDSLRSCPVEDATTALNTCPANPEEHPTSSETLKEDFQDLRVNESNLDDIETTIEDVLSFSSDDQVLLKRPVVMLSHEEVHHYLEDQTKTEENSSASESHLDAVSAKVKSVEEHMDCHVEKSASGVALEEKVSQYPGVKESALTSPQQCISQKRRRFAKPTPNLTRSQQTEEKPLNLQTTEYIDDNPDSLRSCPVEDATTALNKCPASPEEHPTSSETLKEDFQDLRVNESNLDDIETTIDVLSFSSDDQVLLKRPVVMLSHEEVHHYLEDQTKTEENSSASESHLDAVSAKVKSVEEHMDCHVEKSASGVALEEKVSQYPGVKESALTSPQQCISQKRRRFAKPTPNLTRSQQTEEKPLNLQTTEYIDDNPDSLRSCPVEDATTALNKCPASPEEHPTSSETLKENFQDLRVNESNLDDIETTIDDVLSFSSDEENPLVSTNVVQDILSFLESPNLPATLSDEDVAKDVDPLELALSETWENKEQTTDLEDCDSSSETMTEEPLELSVPTSCFKQSTEGSQQNTERHEDSASVIYDVRGYQSRVEAIHCELDLSRKKNITTEDKLVSYEANCKQALDPLSPVQLLGPKQTIGPTVPPKDAFNDNKETSDPILTDILIAQPNTCSQVSTEALGASFSEATTKYPSNTCDMNTMLFCKTTTEDVQRSVSFSEENVNSMGKFQHSISDSVKEDNAENLSKAEEDFSGNAKSDILDSAGVETGEEPTFILTLYEIPTSQLSQEASCSLPEILPYELQPAEVHTPHLLSSYSQSLPSTLEDSSALHMNSQETEKPCNSVSWKVKDDSSVLEDAVKYASKQEITSEKCSFDEEGSHEVLSYNDSVPTDVTGVLKLGEKPLQPTERKAASQRRSKIKVQPNLRPCAKAGPSKTECASSQKRTANINLPTSCDIAHYTEKESNQKTSVQETVGSFVPKVLSNTEESGRQPHHDGPLTARVPVSEDIQDEVPMSWGSHFKTDLQMDKDTAVDLSVRNFEDVPDLHSTAVEQSKEEVEEGCKGVSRVVLVDPLVVSSGEMEDKNRLVGDSESERRFPTVNDQETFSDISEELDTFEEALNLTSTSTSQDGTEQSESMFQVRPEINPETTCNKDETSRQEYLDVRSHQPAITQITLEPQIKKESDKGKEKGEQEDFSDNSKEDLGTPLNLTEDVLKREQQLAQLASTCAETQSVEKTEDVSHVVLSDMFVAVSQENKDDVHMDSESSPLHIRQLCEDPCALEKEQNLTTDADQEVGEHEAVSHMVLDDIFVPVTEEVEDGLGEEQMTIRHQAESTQVKETSLCAISKSTNMEPSLSPERRMTSKKGVLKVKMIFPKRRSRESTASVEESPTSSAEPHSTSTLKQQDICTLKSKKESNSEEIEGSTPFVAKAQSFHFQTQCGVKIKSCAKSPSTDSTDMEEACEGVSHTVFSDIFVPVLDKTTQSSLHKEALMVRFQEPSEQVEELGDEKPTNTERKDLTESQSSEHNMASCRRAESLEHQAEEEWSLRSNVLPIDSNEMENWCEGVSHMLLSDAFVPVSEEENNTDQKDVENAKSLPECGRTSDDANEEHQVDSISGTQKTVKKTKEKPPQSQSITSPERRSTLQMTLRSPRRSPKNKPSSLNSTEAIPTTPQRAKTSIQECIQTPTRLHSEEMIRECKIPLERLSLEEICQHNLQPKHHSTPVNVKFLSKGNDRRKMGLESHAAQEETMPSDGWPKVLLNRINIMATDADTSTSSSSPPRASSTAYRPLDGYQSPQGRPHNSGLNDGDEPASVSQFFLDDIFTEVEDPN